MSQLVVFGVRWEGTLPSKERITVALSHPSMGYQLFAAAESRDPSPRMLSLVPSCAPLSQMCQRGIGGIDHPRAVRAALVRCAQEVLEGVTIQAAFAPGRECALLPPQPPPPCRYCVLSLRPHQEGVAATWREEIPESGALPSYERATLTALRTSLLQQVTSLVIPYSGEGKEERRVVSKGVDAVLCYIYRTPSGVCILGPQPLWEYAKAHCTTPDQEGKAYEEIKRVWTAFVTSSGVEPPSLTTCLAETGRVTTPPYLLSWPEGGSSTQFISPSSAASSESRPSFLDWCSSAARRAGFGD